MLPEGLQHPQIHVRDEGLLVFDVEHVRLEPQPDRDQVAADDLFDEHHNRLGQVGIAARDGSF